MEDHILITRFMHGERSAFIEVYEMYFQDVYNFTAYSIGVTSCEDVTQEVFLKVYRKMESFKGKSSIKSWIFNIARRTTYDYHRKHKKCLNVDDYYNKLITTITPEDVFEYKEDLEDVLRMLGSLKHEQRTAILLRRLHGFSIKETARIMGVKESKVKTLLHRGMKNLDKEVAKKISLECSPKGGVSKYE
ncbi:RNA polymerase sigma factor [Proteinivorax hydrogeniformans]|uniref:RNA polymerase sigma factor n=1 Tax=Proteinivorax hydrogeniformans TaxID=1826727 RepID=A0AAU8HVW5_9FIRM